MNAMVHFTLVKRTYVAHACALKQTFIFGKKKGPFSAKGLSERNMRKYIHEKTRFIFRGIWIFLFNTISITSQGRLKFQEEATI